jgi:hypothetical protein
VVGCDLVSLWRNVALLAVHLFLLDSLGPPRISGQTSGHILLHREEQAEITRS